MSEQIKFGMNLRQYLTDRDIFQITCDAFSYTFIDFIFENYPMVEWFNKYHDKVHINSYMGRKLLISNSHLKDKIMYCALRDSTIIDIFPDITHHEVIVFINQIIH